MHLILWFIFIIVSNFTGADQEILRFSFKITTNQNRISTKIWSNETHFTWILYPPWKRHNDLFNDKPYNNSVEYFSINKEDHITNESYIETSKLIVCNEVNLNFYSKINSSNNTLNLILFTYKHNVWNKEWEYMNTNSQWQLHELKINMTDKYEDIQFRFIPISNSSDQISIAIDILNITTHTNCQNFNQINKYQLKNHSSAHLFLFIIFGSALLFIFIIILIILIYGIINKQCNQWFRKRSSRRRKKGRKTRNVIRDESTVVGLATDAV